MSLRKAKLNVGIVFGLNLHKKIFITATVKNFFGTDIIIRHVERVNKILREQVVVEHALFVEGIYKNICKGRRRHADICRPIEQLQNFSDAIIYRGGVGFGVIGIYGGVVGFVVEEQERMLNRFLAVFDGLIEPRDKIFQNAFILLDHEKHGSV